MNRYIASTKIRVIIVALCTTIGYGGVCFARGVGIKAGEGRLHPSIDLELAYDTNAGYFTGDNDPVADMILRIRPGLTLEFPSEMIDLELSGKFGYDYYFGIDDEKTTDLSTVAGDANLRLGLNPNGQIRFFIEDDFIRSGDPRYNTLDQRYDRTDNEVRARLQWQPSGGALVFDLAYGYFFDIFDKDDSLDSEAYSSYSHRLYFMGKWKFLPKTAVVLSVDMDLRRYPNDFTQGTLDGYRNVEINGLRATLGLLGQVTPTIAVSVKAGYGNTLIPSDFEVYPGVPYPGENYSSIIGQAEITYKAMGTTEVRGGYLRNFQPVVIFGYFGQDQIYASLIQQIAGRFTARADVGFEWLSYGKAIIASSDNSTDTLIYGSVGLEYHIRDWVKTGIRYHLEQRLTDREISTGSKADYTKHIFVLHVGVDY